MHQAVKLMKSLKSIEYNYLKQNKDKKIIHSIGIIRRLDLLYIEPKYNKRLGR